MKEVMGCGIDIEEIGRFKTKIPARANTGGFADLVYTASEITRNLNIHPGLTFPLCFSCKEAFFKAFGVSWINSRISWKDIELLFNDRNNLRDYSIQLSGYAKELFHIRKCCNMESDLEYNRRYVVFQVVLLS
ncbi:MAG: 4'-phosphopantetheinyl transferase superfamily protein [Bacteroidales bacterium]|nr:4'-phosphopantetheinyl transferase superfamily protein [Bacteroidales bacterium]